MGSSEGLLKEFCAVPIQRHSNVVTLIAITLIRGDTLPLLSNVHWRSGMLSCDDLTMKGVTGHIKKNLIPKRYAASNTALEGLFVLGSQYAPSFFFPA